MISSDNEKICKRCKSPLIKYGTVKRKIRIENGDSIYIKIQRWKCNKCGTIERELPDCIIPYKQYRKDIIEGFRQGSFSTDDIPFEDYPSDVTIKAWLTNSLLFEKDPRDS